MLRLIYTFFYILILPFFARSLFKKKPSRPNVGLRWKEFCGITPKLSQRDDPVWFHAVSVGEVLAISPLIKEFHNKYPLTPLLITTTTPTGAEQAKKLSDIAEHRYMPFDFPPFLHLFLKNIHPKKLVLMEMEIWPNTIHQAKLRGADVTIVNARLSDKSMKNYRYLSGLVVPALNQTSLILCQSDRDRNNFISLGVKPDNLAVSGSIKYDISISTQMLSDALKLKETILKDRFVWIAASTHKGEDEIVLNAHRKLLEIVPNALLILTPRHPERFNDVFDLCNLVGFSTKRRSSCPLDIEESTQVYLGDTMGELLTQIGLADVCFMGGSLIGSKVGGHNFLEPASLGKPIISGPSYYNFREIGRELIELGVLEIVDTADELANSISTLAKTDTSLIKKNATEFIKKNSGSIAYTINKI